MKDQCGFLIAHSIVDPSFLVVKLADGIVLPGCRIEIVFVHHPATGFSRCAEVTRGFIIIIIGQIGREAFYPIAFGKVIEHRIPQPGMHNLMAKGIGLCVATPHNALSK